MVNDAVALAALQRHRARRLNVFNLLTFPSRPGPPAAVMLASRFRSGRLTACQNSRFAFASGSRRVYASSTERDMSRVKLVVAASAALLGIALAGCSALPDWATPSWIAGGSSGGAAQPLRFESDPPGADVRTAQGQTCLTPCAIPVPSEPQAVTITKIGFVPQTVQVTVGDVPEHSFWEAAPPPALVPNPVQVVLQPVAPPRPVRRPRPRGGAVARSAASHAARRRCCSSATAGTT